MCFLLYDINTTIWLAINIILIINRNKYLLLYYNKIFKHIILYLN